MSNPNQTCPLYTSKEKKVLIKCLFAIKNCELLPAIMALVVMFLKNNQ